MITYIASVGERQVTCSYITDKVMEEQVTQV